MKRLVLLFALLACICMTTNALAVSIISTDRFGYTGTVVRYDTLGDAQAGTNVKETISIGNRDLSLYIVEGLGSGNDMNAIMGSWWYTTDPLGRSGYGNTRGNTGVGFVQLYDENSVTDTSLSMRFGDFDGAYWTTFAVTLTGANANYSNSYARLSPFSSNVSDSGTFVSYSLALTASGLYGTETTPGLIEATNHPTGITGTFNGLFLNQGSDTAKQGYYVFNLDLDMTNWAFENNDLLTGEYKPIADSYFAASVPEPTTLLLLGLSIAGIPIVRRRRNV